MQLHLIARVEAAGAHAAERLARGAQVRRIGPLAVALEMRARQHDRRRVGEVGQTPRRVAAAMASSNCRWL